MAATTSFCEAFRPCIGRDGGGSLVRGWLLSALVGNQRKRMKRDALSFRSPRNTNRTNSSQARSEFVGSSRPTTRTDSSIPESFAPPLNRILVVLPQAFTGRPINSCPSAFVMTTEVCRKSWLINVDGANTQREVT